MKTVFYALTAAFLSLTVSIAPTFAQDVTAGDLQIEKAWSRATPKGAKVGAGYMTIMNKGAASDRLVSVESPAAGKVEVHEMAMTGGVMKMRPVSGGLAIEPGKSVSLAPGSYHLMMMELKEPLKQGDKVPVTLTFEKTGKVNVMLDVRGIGGQQPAPAHTMPMGDMHKM